MRAYPRAAGQGAPPPWTPVPRTTRSGSPMSRRGTETRKLAGQVLVRLTPKQQTAVAAVAEAYQVSIATWLRWLIAEALDIDEGPVTTRAVPPDIVMQVAQLREVVAELGGALVRSSIAAREDGRPIEHDEIETLIPQIKAVADELLRLKEALWPAVR